MGNVNRTTGKHHGDLRNALISAAEELIELRGVGGWGMADASRHAGVSVAAPYKHFAGRDELIAALAAAGLRELAAEVSAVMSSDGDPRENLSRFAAQYVHFSESRHAKFAAAFLVERDKARFPELVDASNYIFTLLTPSAVSLVGSESAPQLVMSVGALAHGFALLDLPGDRAQSAAQAVGMLASGATAKDR